MSHKYYGLQEHEESNLYTIPFLSTKTQRLRFLNNEFVGYGERNEFLIHKNPGLTILRLGDKYINDGLHNRSNTKKLMTEYLNRLVYSTNSLNLNSPNSFSNGLKIKQISVNLRSSIQIKITT